MATLYMKYDKHRSELIVEVTDDIAFRVIRSLRMHLWPEIERMKMVIVDRINDDGVVYKGIRKYTIPIYEDRVQPFFDAAQHILTEGIKDSIVNSDN